MHDQHHDGRAPRREHPVVATVERQGGEEALTGCGSEEQARVIHAISAIETELLGPIAGDQFDDFVSSVCEAAGAHAPRGRIDHIICEMLRR